MFRSSRVSKAVDVVVIDDRELNRVKQSSRGRRARAARSGKGGSLNYD